MRNKITKFSRLFQNHKLTLPQVIATKSKCQNDLHQGSFHINCSNITGHHRTLIMSEIHETLFIWSPRPWMANYKISANIWMINQNYYVCYNFSLRLHWIPWVLHVQGEKTHARTHARTHTHTHTVMSDLWHLIKNGRFVLSMFHLRNRKIVLDFVSKLA